MTDASLTFLQIGLGSMGKRRVRNLLSLGEKHIIGFDFSADRRKEAEETYGIQTVDSLQKLSDSEYDVIIISTPPHTHGDYLRLAVSKQKHFFVEVPTSDDGYAEVLKSSSVTVKAPSATFRWNPAVQIMKKSIEEGKIGKILAFQYHMGQFLPDWHPWEDYRAVYFSKKESSACREMFVFELIWLNYLFGSTVKEVSGSIAKLSDLEMDADDTITANVTYENNIRGTLLIDVISRKPFRTLCILGSEGVLEWERFDQTVHVYNAASKQTEVIPVPKGNPEKGYVNEEEMYIEEMCAFLDAVSGGAPYPYSFKEDQTNLKALHSLVNKCN